MYRVGTVDDECFDCKGARINAELTATEVQEQPFSPQAAGNRGNARLEASKRDCARIA